MKLNLCMYNMCVSDEYVCARARVCLCNIVLKLKQLSFTCSYFTHSVYIILIRNSSSVI